MIPNSQNTSGASSRIHRARAPDWTEAEEAQLRAMMPDHRLIDIARAMGRSWAATHKKCERMGLLGQHAGARSKQPPAATAPPPDEHLIQLCHELIRLNLEGASRSDDSPPGSEGERRFDKAMVKANRAADRMAEKITRLPARTSAGIEARAALLRAYPARTLIEGIEDQVQGRLILALIADLTGSPYPELS